MADILPFRALRYDPSKVTAGEVMTQPYDKITPSMQDEYYAASPYNLVRIILGKSQPGDNDQENVYTRAAAYLRQWQAEGVLQRDAEPSIYVYVQTFKIPGDPAGAQLERRGFIALGRVEDYDRKVVFRHEQTLSKPKADRLNLLQATQAHCEQIFMLYSDPADEVATLLNEIESGTSRISDLVRAIKEYTFMDQAPLQNVDIVKSLETTLTILNHKLKHGVVVKRDYGRVPLLVNSFGSELNQVWTNLIDNAIDAMGGEGELRVRTYRDDDCVVVEIEDSGPGISPDVLPHIFEPFFTTKGVGEGTGLGLDTVQRIVKKHRGDIQVTSKPGDTRFQVWLPSAPSAA